MWELAHKERWRIVAFELWWWRRLLRVPGTARRSNQSILKAINPKYSLEGLMLKLKLQYFGYLMRKANSLERTLMVGEIEGKRRRGNIGWDGWMASLTQWTWVWANSGRCWRTGKPGVLVYGVRKIGHDLVTKQWTAATKFCLCVASTRDLMSGLLLQLQCLNHDLVCDRVQWIEGHWAMKGP